jgi:endo-1,4-beta-D-glucanase Y
VRRLATTSGTVVEQRSVCFCVVVFFFAQKISKKSTNKFRKELEIDYNDVVYLGSECLFTYERSPTRLKIIVSTVIFLFNDMILSR